MDHAAFFRVLGGWLREQLGDTRLAGVGHRVVHGGTEFAAPVRIDDEVLAKLDRLCPLAPLHQPHNLAGIRAVAAAQPDLPQVACFDTAFHRAHSELADWFALPRRFYDDGIRRYGFHGLSYEYIARTLPAVAPELKDASVVVAHLGSGASMCAMRAGRSVDSTMGFTALDGLPMGTRCGALDPGVVLHLIRAYRMDADAIEAMLYHDCGLKGVSGISNDMRDLLASDDPRAAQAVELFVWHIAKQLGALAAVLGGLDAFVFTAGIGERSPEIRAAGLRPGRLAWHRDRRGRQQGRRAAHLDRRQQGRGVRDPDRRGADDRPAHAGCAERRVSARRGPMLDNNLRRLEGKKGLVIGIANEHSIAWGCARAFRAFGAELAITYLNDKAKPYVEPLAEELEAPLFLPLDVQIEGQMEAVFAAIGERFGRLDFALHSIAFAPQGGPARPRRRLLARRLSPGDGRVLPLLHPHGAARRAADEGRRRAVHDELLRRREGGRELQPDGPREGRARSVRTLSRGRARPEGHPRACDLAGAAEDPRRLRHR